ncbi:hypothetical protein JMJ77_0010508 [Colletotrichum scovillei]|uniref:Uncharacterized protein n=1 Tax=Colletotrichum scovillei TaxID=1209932 RepID=A0A9P7QT34_9PEZI|nr:hypothetical protein JMJ78_0011883 [Colletotrichum scovillei]KAG7042409.1 hypothetical protein JMJ77_0010508 [Colletotrichum scovillei]KAG7062441.1 hypothetical protein JMJ76_0006715 [Colletotrichum scovillei]
MHDGRSAFFDYGMPNGQPVLAILGSSPLIVYESMHAGMRVHCRVAWRLGKRAVDKERKWNEIASKSINLWSPLTRKQHIPGQVCGRCRADKWRCRCGRVLAWRVPAKRRERDEATNRSIAIRFGG